MIKNIRSILGIVKTAWRGTTDKTPGSCMKTSEDVQPGSADSGSGRPFRSVLMRRDHEGESGTRIAAVKILLDDILDELSPFDPNTIYFGAQYLFRSRDRVLVAATHGRGVWVADVSRVGK